MINFPNKNKIHVPCGSDEGDNRSAGASSRPLGFQQSRLLGSSPVSLAAQEIRFRYFCRNRRRTPLLISRQIHPRSYASMVRGSLGPVFPILGVSIQRLCIASHFRFSPSHQHRVQPSSILVILGMTRDSFLSGGETRQRHLLKNYVYHLHHHAQRGWYYSLA